MIKKLDLGKLKGNSRIAVLSDIHFGDGHLSMDTVNTLCARLEIEDYDLIILAGDIIELWGHPDRSNAILQHETLRTFLKCAHKLRGEIVYVRGNHDYDLSLPRLRGGERLQEAVNLVFGEMVGTLEFRIHGKKFRIQHGDSYDPANADGGKWWARLLSSFNMILGNAGIYYGKYRDKFSFARDASDRMHEDQLQRVLNRNWDVDFFIFGHTHRPLIRKSDKRVVLVNAGSVMQGETFVVIENGVPSIANLG